MPHEVPNITITFRDEGRGKAALWDHKTTQNITPSQTMVAWGSKLPPTMFKPYLKDLTRKPEVLNANAYGQGLLLIPGRTRDIESKRPLVQLARSEFEQAILKDALRRGRPILGICGGSYELIKALGYEAPFLKVEGHDYAVKHPKQDLCLNEKGKVHANVQVHTVDINTPSLLADAVGFACEMSVNSIHELAINQYSLPSDVTVSSKSRRSLIPGEPATEGSLESFEHCHIVKTRYEKTIMTYGAPTMGVQWHIEAYETKHDESEPQYRLFNYMVKAGVAYDAKQAMLEQLKQGAGKNNDKKMVKNMVEKGFFKPIKKEGLTRLGPQLAYK